MADQDRDAAYALIEELRKAPYRFDFFQAMRSIECHYRGKPRLGASLKASDDPIRLAQSPEMGFAPSALEYFGPAGEDGPERLTVRFLGLFGPHGPLPLHLTEYARERLRNHNDPAFARFADIFHHRMLCLLYRAWASAEPTVQYDRRESDRYAGYAGSLFGIGMSSLRERDAMPDRAKLFFAGHMACQAKHAEGLKAVVATFFGIEASVREFVGEWMDIAIGDQTRLGAAPHAGILGVSAVVGARVYGRQHKFRVILGPMDLASFRAFLPGQGSLRELQALVRNYIGDELAWDINPALKKKEAPDLRLDGAAQLGWTTWLGTRRGEEDLDDVLLNPFFHAR
jgi:type VI secretion system protein ImpH